VSTLLASFDVGAWYTWAIPIAAVAIVWTFVFVVVLGRGEEGE
jgi:hypothetical protein